MVMCAVFGCGSNGRNMKRDNFKLFRFPVTNKALLKQWIHACRRSDGLNLKNARVCSRHFSAADFTMEYLVKKEFLNDYPQGKRSLKANAIPTLNLPLPSLENYPLPHLENYSESSKHRKQRAEEKHRRQLVQDLLYHSVFTSDPSAAPLPIPAAAESQASPLLLHPDLGPALLQAPVLHSVPPTQISRDGQTLSVLPGNSTSAVRSIESSWKNPGTSQGTLRVRKYSSLKEVESYQSSSDEECLKKNTCKAVKPETKPLAETSQRKEPQVHFDVAERPKPSKLRRLSTEKDNNVEGNSVPSADWERVQIKQEIEVFDGILTGDVQVKQELNEGMELIKEEHDIDVTGDH